MKQLTILLIAAFLAINSFCQEYIEFKPSENTDARCNILTSNDTIVEFEVILPGIYSTEVDSFNRVEVKDHSRMKSAGSPEVPVLTFLVAIPECDDVNIAVELLDSIRIENINIYPAPEIVEDSTGEGSKFLREEFYYDETVYSNNSYFPGILAETVNKGAVREQHCVRVFLYPVWFNPVLNEIMAYSNMKVTVTFENASGPVNENVGIFNEMLGNTMVNYVSNGLNASASCGAGDGTYDPEDYWVTSIDPPNYCIEDPCDYLIITPGEFFDNPDISNLAIHREGFNGFDVKIITTTVINDDMPGNFLYLKIRDLIKNTYNEGVANNTYDGKLAYVNLFSDVNLESGNPGAIPTYDEGFDIFYTQLTIPPGETDPDPYPDIMIGRCSADDAEQVANVAYKTINFDPGNMTGNNRMLFTFCDDNAFYDDYSNILWSLDNISMLGNYDKQIMLPNDYFYNFTYPDWGNDPLPFSSSTIPNELTSGLLFLNYCGHGGELGWDIGFNYEYISPSIHTDKIPFIISAACKTGSFQLTDEEYEDCMAERFLCYDNNMGSIGFYGASGITNSSSYLVEYYYHKLFNNFSYVLGENLMEIKMAMV